MQFNVNIDVVENTVFNYLFNSRIGHMTKSNIEISKSFSLGQISTYN